jgi:hypothetical protein
MRDDRASGHFEKQFVRTRAHADAFAGGDKNGGVHAVNVAACRLQTQARPQRNFPR